MSTTLYARLTALNGARSVVDLIVWTLVLGLLALAGVQFLSPEAPLLTWLAGLLRKWGDPALEVIGSAIGAEWPEQTGHDGKLISNWWLPLIPVGALLVLRKVITSPLTRGAVSLRRRIASGASQRHPSMPPVPSGQQPGLGASLGGSPTHRPLPKLNDTDQTLELADGTGGPQHIGRYQILSELGRGAMGVVFKAVDPALSRTVAIKRILTDQMMASELEMYTVRLYAEAKAGGRLNHPGIAAVHDLVVDRDGLAIVMEFIDGCTLQSKLDRERPTVADGLDLGIQIADALGCAHAQNIIHRDIKPANIMVTPEGKAKITDFGIAKLEGTQLTQTGLVVGTPAFMSPEQFSGKAVQAPSDVFSLGSVLYLVLTGEKPFSGDAITTIVYKVTQTEPIPPRVLDPEIPEDLEYVLQKSLTKNPADRYPTGAEMARDLECVRDGQKLHSRSDDG